jgi:hypothetical protein
VRREDIFKPTIGNESLHATSSDNGVRVVNYATTKNLTVKSKMFPHRNIHKVTWTSPDGRTHNQIDHTVTCWMVRVTNNYGIRQMIGFINN